MLDVRKELFAMPKLHGLFSLERCPHCSINKPYMPLLANAIDTTDHANGNKRTWCFYKCSNCGGVVTAAAQQKGYEATEIYPTPRSVDDAIPDRAKEYLKQAIDSIHAPSGAVMLAASSVDAMLKEKTYKSGSLYQRIEKAVEDNLITSEMAKWAHEVRLDANDQRHADNNVSLPTEADAKRVIDFVTALAQFLFVLPQMVKRGIADASEKTSNKSLE